MSYNQDIEKKQQPGYQPEPEIQHDIRNKPRIHPELFQRVDFTEDMIGFHGGSQKRAGVKLALWTWLSASVDALIIVSMSCFFVVAFSLLMKTSAAQIIKTILQDVSAIKLLGVSFLMSFWMYLIFMRVFNGATMGEWACQLRLGQPSQRTATNYVTKVLVRTTVIMLTGIIFLPLLSLIVKRDLAGELSGLKMYSLI